MRSQTSLLAPRANPLQHPRAWGLLKRGGAETTYDDQVTAPVQRMPDGEDVEITGGGYAFAPITLAAAVGATGSAVITVDQSSDFEWLQLLGYIASPVTVEFHLLGGPFAGLALTSRPIDSRLITGVGTLPYYLPTSSMIPKNASIRMTLTNQAAVGQTIRLVAAGRKYYTALGRSAADWARAVVPYWYGFDALPLGANARTNFTLPPNTAGTFNWHHLNAGSQTAAGGAFVVNADTFLLNIQERGGNRQQTWFPAPGTADVGVPNMAVCGTGQLPYYLPVRTPMLPGDTLDIQIQDISAANNFIRGVLAGTLTFHG